MESATTAAAVVVEAAGRPWQPAARTIRAGQILGAVMGSSSHRADGGVERPGGPAPAVAGPADRDGGGAGAAGDHLALGAGGFQEKPVARLEQRQRSGWVESNLEAQAIQWYGRAADGGLAQAQYELAELMFEDSASGQRAMELLMTAAARGHAGANTRLGVFFQLGTYVEKNHARAQLFYEVATIQGDLTARNNLAWLLATSPSADLRNGSRAVTLAQPLAVLYDNWGYLDTLAAAQAETGDFAAASRTERKAVTQAASDASAEALQDLKHRLTLFEADEPYREP